MPLIQKGPAFRTVRIENPNPPLVYSLGGENLTSERISHTTHNVHCVKSKHNLHLTLRICIWEEQIPVFVMH